MKQRKKKTRKKEQTVWCRVGGTEEMSATDSVYYLLDDLRSRTGSLFYCSGLLLYILACVGVKQARERAKPRVKMDGGVCAASQDVERLYLSAPAGQGGLEGEAGVGTESGQASARDGVLGGEAKGTAGVWQGGQRGSRWFGRRGMGAESRQLLIQ